MDNYEPLTESYFYILLNLSKKIDYGYAIMKNTKEITKGKVNIGSATMYTAISKMMKKGWVEELATEDGKYSKRRKYKITKEGEDVLKNEIERYKMILKSIKEVEKNG